MHDLHHTKNFPQQTPHIVSFRRNEFYLLSEEEILFYDAESKTHKTIAFAADTSLKTFAFMASDYNGRIWILGQTGLAEIQYTDSVWNEDSEWRFHFYPDEIDYSTPRTLCVYPGSELVVTLASNMPRHKHLLHYKGNKWSVLYSGDFAAGWLGIDGGCWILKLSHDLVRFSFCYYLNNIMYCMKPNKFNQEVFHLVSNTKESFWFSNRNGLNQYQTPLWRKDRLFPDPHDTSFLTAGMIDSSSTMWVASKGT